MESYFGIMVNAAANNMTSLGDYIYAAGKHGTVLE